MKRNDLLFILISSCLLSLAWIIFSIYHASISSTINRTITQEIKPINPTFNTSGIQELKTRIQVTPAYELKTSSHAATIISPTTIPTQTLSTSSTHATTSSQLTP